VNNDTYKIAELYNEQVSSYVDSYIQNKSKTTTPYNYTPLPVSSAPPVNAMPRTSTTSVPRASINSLSPSASPAYRLLAGIDMYPGKQYNFWEMARKWYQNNTQFSDKEIENMLSKKQLASQQAGFNNRTATLGHPQNWKGGSVSVPGGTTRAYYDLDNNTVYINPALNNLNLIWRSILHELLHSVQPEDMHKAGYSSNTLAGDYVSYTAEPVEMDTALGELNRVVAVKFNKLIVPGNEKEAEKFIRWFTDMKNTDYPRMHDKASAMLLRAIQRGKTAEEQNTIIKELARRMVFLTSNQKPIKNIA